MLSYAVQKWSCFISLDWKKRYFFMSVRLIKKKKNVGVGAVSAGGASYCGSRQSRHRNTALTNECLKHGVHFSPH
jgi:hypothetical protein